MASLSLSLLGTLAAHLDETPVTGFEYDKVRALLVYLAVECDRPHRREFLAGLLWPDYPEDVARQSLSQALFVLRRAIGDRAATPPFLLITPQTLQFNHESYFRADFTQFTTLWETAQSHAHADLFSCDTCRAGVEQAVSLYRGDFLAGFSLPDCPEFEMWITVQREQVRRQALEMLQHLTAGYLQCAEHKPALAYARRQLELDPWCEAAHRQAMLALALIGQRAEALAQYEACRQILRTELDVTPESATTTLYERIRAAGELDGEALRTALEMKTLAPAPGAPPFKGLDFFDVADAAVFFGREILTTHLVNRIRGGCRFLAVVGASGSGKSSLVRAGVAATLRREGWDVRVFTPGAVPLQNLQITQSANQPSGQNQVSSTQHLLIVDQFEELFTLCPDSDVRRAFVEHLLTITRDEVGGAQVVIALRADFYHHCAQFDALRAALECSQAYIGAMSVDELRRAIETPARRAGWEFEPGLVDIILHDVGAEGDQPPEPGALPLLSHALLETWKRRRGHTLTLSGYAEAGSVRGAITCTAEAVYQELDAEQQAIARNIFQRLTELGEGIQGTRRQVTLAELRSQHAGEAAVDRVLARLTDARLVTTEQETVQVAHEALIREWPTLRGWLEEDREGLRIHRHLTKAAQVWARAGRDPGELYRGARLAQATEWAAAHSAALNTVEREFLAAAQAGAEREEAEREAQRQRELEAAQRLAETEKRRAEEGQTAARQLRRRARFLAIAAAGILVVAITAALLWNRARITSRENAALAGENAHIAAENANIAATAVAVSEMEAAQRAAAEAAQQREAEQRTAAEAARTEADKQRVAAETAEREALIQASVGLASRALDELNGVSPERAVLLALAALEEYPYTPQAESALAHAVYENRPYTVLSDPGGSENLSRAAWSPDGKYVAVSEQFQQDVAVIWDVATAKVAQHLPWDAERALQCATVDIAWSPDGARVVISSFHDTLAKCTAVQVRDVASGDLLLTLSSEGLWPWGVDWSPDGNTILAAYTDGSVRTWDAATGNEQLVISVTTSWALDAVWSPEGTRFATTSGDGITRIWNVHNGDLLLALSGHIGGVNSVAWSPDGTQLATAGRDGTIRIWDTTSGEAMLALTGHSGGGSNVSFVANGVLAVTWSQDGARIATAGNDRTVRMWNAVTGEELLKYYGVTNAWHVAWSPDSKHLAIRGGEETRILDLSTEPLRLYGSTDEVWDAPWSPDGTRIATSGVIIPGQIEETVRVWDAVSGKEFLQLPKSSSCRYLAWAPDGKRLVTANNPAQIWDAETGELVQSIPYPTTEGLFWLVTWSPDGEKIATTNVFEFTVSLYDAVTGKHIRTFGEPDCFKAADWSPDNSRIATGCYLAQGDAAPVRIWDAATGEKLLAMDSPGGDTTFVEWSPDGSKLASGHTGGMAMVWDTTTGENLVAFAGHDDWVWDVTWSPNGERIASGDISGIVKIWDAATGAEVLSFQAPNEILRLDWSPDGEHLTVAGKFNEPMVQRVWQSTADLIAYAHECCVFRELTPEERAQFMLGEH